MEIWEMLLGIFIVLYQQGFSLCTRCLWDEFCISCPSVVCSTPSFQTRSSACILCTKVRVEAIRIKKLLHKRYRMSRSRFSPLWGHAVCQPNGAPCSPMDARPDVPPPAFGVQVAHGNRSPPPVPVTSKRSNAHAGLSGGRYPRKRLQVYLV